VRRIIGIIVVGAAFTAAVAAALNLPALVVGGDQATAPALVLAKPEKQPPVHAAPLLRLLPRRHVVVHAPARAPVSTAPAQVAQLAAAPVSHAATLRATPRITPKPPTPTPVPPSGTPKPPPTPPPPPPPPPPPTIAPAGTPGDSEHGRGHGHGHGHKGKGDDDDDQGGGNGHGHGNGNGNGHGNGNGNGGDHGNGHGGGKGK
jgi:hypothetical protein